MSASAGVLRYTDLARNAFGRLWGAELTPSKVEGLDILFVKAKVRDLGKLLIEKLKS